MTNDTPLTASDTNRREYFRIDEVLPLSLRKVTNFVPPTPHIYPVAANSSTLGGTWEGGLNTTFVEFDSNFTLMLIEVHAKLDLLLNAQRSGDKAARDTSPTRLSMSQLLLQINLKLEHLLGEHHLLRPDDRIRIDPISLSASGIKLTTEEPLAVGDLVELRMLMNIGAQLWIVVGGSVVRSTLLATGKREVAIHFTDMDEAIRDEISRYALMSQKKQILARRGMPPEGGR